MQGLTDVMPRVAQKSFNTFGDVIKLLRLPKWFDIIEQALALFQKKKVRWRLNKTQLDIADILMDTLKQSMNKMRINYEFLKMEGLSQRRVAPYQLRGKVR